jgi:hypothetical protein
MYPEVESLTFGVLLILKFLLQHVGESRTVVTSACIFSRHPNDLTVDFFPIVMYIILVFFPDIHHMRKLLTAKVATMHSS